MKIIIDVEERETGNSKISVLGYNSEYIENALFVFGAHCYRKGLGRETMLSAISAGYLYGEDVQKNGNP